MSAWRVVGAGGGGVSMRRPVSGQTLGGSPGLADGPVLRHVSDLVVVQPEHLIPLTISVGVDGSPVEPHHHTVRYRPHNLSVRCHVWSKKPLKLLEDRPGLDRPVSRRRVAPPQTAVLQPSPLKLRMEQAHQRVKIAGEGSVVGSLNLGCPDWRHASTVAAWTLAPDRPARPPGIRQRCRAPHLHTPAAHRGRAVSEVRRARHPHRSPRTIDRRRSQRGRPA